ncbi:MAG: hypothetical protein REH83_02845 [Rickettsiella sp.]|nr:hypothetical protein [Rickettsiella sp.]
MTSTVLDTFTYVKKLETAGVPSKQAEAHIGLIAKIFQKATSSRQAMRETESKIEIQLKDIEIKLKGLELKIEKVKAALNAQMAKWVLSTATAQTALIILYIRFLH